MLIAVGVYRTVFKHCVTIITKQTLPRFSEARHQVSILSGTVHSPSAANALRSFQIPERGPGIWNSKRSQE